jgi:hypothetical protein
MLWFDCWQPKWSVSVFAGSGLMGPGKDLEAAMNKSGLYDKISDSEGLFFPAEQVLFLHLKPISFGGWH